MGREKLVSQGVDLRVQWLASDLSTLQEFKFKFNRGEDLRFCSLPSPSKKFASPWPTFKSPNGSDPKPNDVNGKTPMLCSGYLNQAFLAENLMTRTGQEFSC